MTVVTVVPVVTVVTVMKKKIVMKFCCKKIIVREKNYDGKFFFMEKLVVWKIIVMEKLCDKSILLGNTFRDEKNM